MRNFVFIADDWGLSAQIHEAVVELTQLRAIDGAGILVGQQYSEAAMEHAGACHDFLSGIHLYANDPDCQSLSRQSWPTGWPADGPGLAAASLAKGSRDLILAEVHEQLLQYKKSGLPLHFINSHFHFHALHWLMPEIIRLTTQLFPDFSGWVRLGKNKVFNGPLPTNCRKLLFWVKPFNPDQSQTS